MNHPANIDRAKEIATDRMWDDAHGTEDAPIDERTDLARFLDFYIDAQKFHGDLGEYLFSNFADAVELQTMLLQYRKYDGTESDLAGRARAHLALLIGESVIGQMEEAGREMEAAE